MTYNHFDLYRLSVDDELEELRWTLDNGISFVEWAERLDAALLAEVSGQCVEVHLGVLECGGREIEVRTGHLDGAEEPTSERGGACK